MKLPAPPQLPANVSHTLETVQVISSVALILWIVVILVQVWRGRGMRVLYRFNPGDHGWVWIVTAILTITMIMSTWLTPR